MASPRNRNRPIESIWVLGKERDFASILGSSLGDDFKVRHFRELKKLKQRLNQEAPRKVSLFIVDTDVTDIGTPDRLKDLSREGPVLVISSSNEVDTISRCLGCGATDFLIKPVDLNLLTVKVREFIKRYSRARLESCNGLWFDPVHFTVLDEFDGKVRLTRREFQLLLSIARASPGGLFRSELYSHVWGDLKVVDKAVDVHIFHLRRKIAVLGFTIRYAREGKYHLAKELS